MKALATLRPLLPAWARTLPEVHPAALPSREQDLGDSRLDPLMGIGDDRLHTPGGRGGSACAGLPACQLALGLVPLVRVNRTQAQAIGGDHAATDQTKGSADGKEALARDLDRTSIVMAEVGDGLEVENQLASQPHQLDIATGLALQLPA